MNVDGDLITNYLSKNQTEEEEDYTGYVYKGSS